MFFNYQRDMLRSGLRIVAEPDRVEAFRLDYDRRLGKGGNRYQETAGPISVPESTVRSVSKTLLAPDTYDSAFYTCSFIPDSKLTFHRGAERIDVLFAFGCNQLQVQRNGEIIGYRFFLARSPYFEAFKECFPQNEPPSHW
jgi:hypothetical protein